MQKMIFKTYYALCPGKGALQSVIPEKNWRNLDNSYVKILDVLLWVTNAEKNAN